MRATRMAEQTARVSVRLREADAACHESIDVRAVDTCQGPPAAGVPAGPFELTGSTNGRT